MNTQKDRSENNDKNVYISVDIEGIWGVADKKSTTYGGEARIMENIKDSTLIYELHCSGGIIR